MYKEVQIKSGVARLPVSAGNGVCCCCCHNLLLTSDSSFFGLPAWTEAPERTTRACITRLRLLGHPVGGLSSCCVLSLSGLQIAIAGLPKPIT